MLNGRRVTLQQQLINTAAGSQTAPEEAKTSPHCGAV